MFISAGLEFRLANTGTDHLEFYLVNEPTPRAFKPRKDLLVKDANTIPITSSAGTGGTRSKPASPPRKNRRRLSLPWKGIWS